MSEQYLFSEGCIFSGIEFQSNQLIGRIDYTDRQCFCRVFQVTGFISRFRGFLAGPQSDLYSIVNII